MDPNEKKVKSYLEDLGVIVNSFSKKEKRSGKTPDFRVFRISDFMFYCEVKSITEDRWLDQQLDNTVSGELAGAARNDPIFNRLTSDIHDAVKQFEAVNSRQIYPNVLAFVNHDNMCGFNDLLGVVTGKFYSNDEKVHPIYHQFSHGRIKEEKEKIHLYVWLDDYKLNRLLFNQKDEIHHLNLCAVFGIQPDEIKQISG
jgi:hypothetical protein